MVLNREYKPLRTLDRNTWVDYKRHAIQFNGLTKEVAGKIAWEGKYQLDRIWLYADHIVPTDSAA